MIGQTDAELANGILELHAPSIGRIEVRARWTEYLDDVDVGHRKVPMQSVATTYDVTQGWTSGMAFPPQPGDPLHRHELGAWEGRAR